LLGSGTGAAATASGAATAPAAAAATPAAVGAATVAVPIAVGVYLAVAVVDLVSYGNFQVALRKQGYVILPNILQTCIGLCHQAPAPTFKPTIPLDTTDLMDKPQLEDWIKPKSTTSPQPAPEPQPKPEPNKEEDKKKDCRQTPRRTSRGDDPLADLFCSEAGFGGQSVDIWSTVGSAEIDALVGRNWFECKCGQLAMVRAQSKGAHWSKSALEGSKKPGGKLGLDEQIRRQKRIADHCGLIYTLVVASEEVAAFFRERYPDIKVVVKAWEPCES
jgi:hypothetical protein